MIIEMRRQKNNNSDYRKMKAKNHKSDYRKKDKIKGS